MTIPTAVFGAIIPDSWGTDVAHAVNRAGCHLERSTNQTLAASSSTDVTWPTETDDTDGYYTPTGSTVTIPADHDGIYVVSFGIDTDTTTLSNIRLDINAASYLLAPVGGEAGAGSIVLPLVEGDDIKLRLVNGATAGDISTGFLSVYRLSI